MKLLFSVLMLPVLSLSFGGCASSTEEDVSSAEAAYTRTATLLDCRGVGQWDPFLNVSRVASQPAARARHARSLYQQAPENCRDRYDVRARR